MTAIPIGRRHGRSLRRGAAVASMVAAALATVSGGALAAVDELLVTATKRGNISVQDIPGGIRAISGDLLDQFNLRDFEDYARLEPALQFANQGVGDSQLIIRGIQSPGASTVGLYFGEAVISGSNFEDGGGRSPNIKLYDMERVEILKGPQGTLFGASSMSGTVRLIPNAPDSTKFDGALEGRGALLEDSDEEDYAANGMVNIPIAEDVFAIRGVGWYINNGGFNDQTIPVSGLLLEDVNDEQTWGGRISAMLTPTPELTITAMALHQDIEVDGNQFFDPRVGDRVMGVSPPPFPVFDDVTPSFFAPYSRGFWDENLDLYSGVVEYDAGFADFLATANYLDRDMLWNFDTSGVAYSFFLPGHPKPFGPPSGGAYSVVYPLFQTQERSIFSSEVRMSTKFEGPFNFVLGLFYEKDKGFNNAEVTSADPDTGIPFCSSIEECIAIGEGDQVTFGRTVDTRLRQGAAFLHTTFELTEQWTFGAGIRYFRSRQHNFEFLVQAVGPPPVPPAPIQGGVNQADPIPTIDVKSSEAELTYDFDLSWDITEDHMLYFSAGSGFRAGGINSAGLATSFGVGVPSAFDPDKVWNYELGAKTSWFDDRLVINPAVFMMNWKDMQVPGVAVSGATDFIANAGKARILGAELELTANPVEGLLINLGISYLHAKLTEDQPFVGIDTDPDEPGVQEAPIGLDGDRIPRVPRWAASGGLQYSHPLWNTSVDGVFGANWSYTGKSSTFFNDSDPFRADIGDYFLLDLTASVRAENWEFGLFSDNVTDKVAIVDVDHGLDGFRAYTVRPRTIGLFARIHM